MNFRFILISSKLKFKKNLKREFNNELKYITILDQYVK